MTYIWKYLRYLYLITTSIQNLFTSSKLLSFIPQIFGRRTNLILCEDIHTCIHTDSQMYRHVHILRYIGTITHYGHMSRGHFET